MEFEQAKLGFFILELIIRLSPMCTMISYRYLHVPLWILLSISRNNNITKEISFHHLIKSRSGFLFDLYHDSLLETHTHKQTPFLEGPQFKTIRPNLLSLPSCHISWGCLKCEWADAKDIFWELLKTKIKPKS